MFDKLKNYCNCWFAMLAECACHPQAINPKTLEWVRPLVDQSLKTCFDFLSSNKNCRMCLHILRCDFCTCTHCDVDVETIYCTALIMYHSNQNAVPPKHSQMPCCCGPAKNITDCYRKLLLCGKLVQTYRTVF